jgi:hypothetical protein
MSWPHGIVLAESVILSGAPSLRRKGKGVVNNYGMPAQQGQPVPRRRRKRRRGLRARIIGWLKWIWS